MRGVLDGLEKIAVAAKQTDMRRAEEALKSLEAELGAAKRQAGAEAQALLGQLEGELKVWREKMPVIFPEPAGRAGMGKHARFWKDKLGSVK